MTLTPFLTVDNLDGNGPIDYSAAISADSPLKIARVLNQPSICSGLLEVAALPVPARRGRVIVTAVNGVFLFTGYLATEPIGIYAGVSSTGPVYRYAFSAISDEWLLDKQTPTLLALSLASSAAAALTTLAQRSGAGILNTAGVTNARAVGVFEAPETAPWSRSAGELAAATYSAYRAVSGALTMQSAGMVVHVLDFDTGGGCLSVAALKTSSAKELANDVTLSGELEPAAYIAETFQGDGTTTVFQLTDAPFRPTTALRDLIVDDFNASIIDTQIWQLTDPGSHLSLSANGLTMNGGNGYDGQTTLVGLDFIEIGGSLVIEASRVVLTGASVGVLCGLYNGPVSIPNCLAGYSVTQSAGVPSITPLLNGAPVGTTFVVQPGHTYTLRVRLNCPELQRVAQTYYAMVASSGGAGVVEAFGGGAVAAPIVAVFDLVDLGAASNTPATVLFDGATAAPIASTPASCIFAAVDCVQIFGSIGAITLTQTGSAWITSTLPSGTKQTRLIGIAGQGADCKLSATGLVTFFAGRTPVAGEYVTVTYRDHRRAVTRLEDTASIAAETSTGSFGSIPGTARWLGKVLKPPARTSADCESAALAILSFSTSRAAALSGSCEAVNLDQQADVWPGDALALTENGTSINVIVRRVEIEPASSFPEAITYRIAFANDWAEGLGLMLSETIAADAILPVTATNSTAVAAGTTLQNLQQLQLLSATTTALQIDTGLAPPIGGGFEVRRRDNAFGTSLPQDLVLRSPVRSFSIPREAQVEQYFVRMYDASTPPLYSRFSSAVFINLPVS